MRAERTPRPARPTSQADDLRPDVRAAIDCAQISERASDPDAPARVAVVMPGGRVFMHGEPATEQAMRAEFVDLNADQVQAATKALASRIRSEIQRTRKQRRTATSWINNW
jgi:hypothetical protein